MWRKSRQVDLCSWVKALNDIPLSVCGGQVVACLLSQRDSGNVRLKQYAKAL